MLTAANHQVLILVATLAESPALYLIEFALFPTVQHSFASIGTVI